MTHHLSKSWLQSGKRVLQTSLACLTTAGLLTCLAPTAFADPPTELPPLDPLDEVDNSNRLISGTTTVVELSGNGYTDLKFMADGPGMLTVSYTDTNNGRSFEVLGPNGQRLSWSSRVRMEHAQAGDVQVAYMTVPLAQAGEHTVRLRAGGTGQLGVGAAWMPFEQVAIGLIDNNQFGHGEVIIQQAPPPPLNPDPDDATVITPGVAQAGQVPAGQSDRTFAWMRFTAETDGELALIFTSARGDLTLELYEEGNYNRALQDIDNDLNSSVGTEGMVINARAGTTYMVSINNLRASQVDFNVRSVWLADEAEETAGEDGAEEAPNGPGADAGHGHGEGVVWEAEDAGVVIEGEVIFGANGEQVIINRGNFIDDKDLQVLIQQQQIQLELQADIIEIETVEEAAEEAE